MVRFTFLTFLMSTCLAAAPAFADWVIFADGQRTRVEAVEVTDRAVHITTLSGKRWSVLRAVVDVDATEAVNRAEAPLEIVAIAPEPPVAAPPPIDPPPRVAETRPTPAPPPPGVPPAPQVIIERDVAPPRAEAMPLPAPSDRRHRFSISLNGVTATETLQFTDTNQFELFKEQAQFQSVYRDPRSQGLELGAQVRIAGPFAVGGAVQIFRHDREAVYQASLPHPFFFDRFRELSGSESGLTHEETVVHLDAVLTQTWGPVTVDAFGGPSWFRTRTEVLVDVVYDEVFPYDDVLFQGVEGRVLENQPIGFNVGASATFRIASIFGLDFGVRYSEARAKLFVEDDRRIELDVGGLRFGAGLRLLFP